MKKAKARVSKAATLKLTDKEVSTVLHALEHTADFFDSRPKEGVPPEAANHYMAIERNARKVASRIEDQMRIQSNKRRGWPRKTLVPISDKKLHRMWNINAAKRKSGK